MRITGGSARGINLEMGRARNVRPATDRSRAAVFSSLGERFVDARFLDLFAGTGSYGLEALSRGAAGGIFVEKQPQAVEAIRRNISAVAKSMGLSGLPVHVVRRDVLRFASHDRFGILFMDPPYELVRERSHELLELAHGLMDPESGPVLVYELPGDLEIDDSRWRCLKRIGKSGMNEPSIAILEPVFP